MRVRVVTDLAPFRAVNNTKMKLILVFALSTARNMLQEHAQALWSCETGSLRQI